MPKLAHFSTKTPNSLATSHASSLGTSNDRNFIPSPQTRLHSSRSATTVAAATAAAGGVASAYGDVSLKSPREGRGLTPVMVEGSSERSHQFPAGQSILHVSPSRSFPISPLNPDYYNRRSAAVSAGEQQDTDTALSPPISYRGVDSKKKNDVSANSVMNPMALLFSRLGGWGGGKSPRQKFTSEDGDTSNESSPSVVHMADESGSDSGNNNNPDPTTKRGQAGKTTPKKGRGRQRGGFRGSGISKVAKVQDLQAAFGLDNTNDYLNNTLEMGYRSEEEGEEEVDLSPGGFRGSGVTKVAGVQDFRSAFGLGKDKSRDDDDKDQTGGKKKKKTKKKKRSPTSSNRPGIGGFGDISMGDASSSDEGNDLADAARAIQCPLYGDASRMVGRQNARAGAGASAGARGTPGRSPGTALNFPSNTSATTTNSNSTSTSTGGATVVDGYSRKLSDVDLE